MTRVPRMPRITSQTVGVDDCWMPYRNAGLEAQTRQNARNRPSHSLCPYQGDLRTTTCSLCVSRNSQSAGQRVGRQVNSRKRETSHWTEPAAPFPPHGFSAATDSRSHWTVKRHRFTCTKRGTAPGQAVRKAINREFHTRDAVAHLVSRRPR